MQSPTEKPPVPPLASEYAPLHSPPHYQPLLNGIPEWLGKSSQTRRDALKNARRTIPDTFKLAPRAQHLALRAAIADHMQAQNSVDRLLEGVQDAHTFAEPLLKTGLKSRYGLELDVRATFLRLYIPITPPGLSIRTGVRVWTVSLLDAALHNFEEHETRADAYDSDSCFISKPSATGQFETLPALGTQIGIPAFTRLCRELDIGAGYKRYLETSLGISDPAVAAELTPKVKATQIAGLKAALELARLNRDIDELWYRLIGGLSDGLQGMRVNGQTLRCHDLTMMSAELAGIVIFAPDLEQASRPAGVVAYVPDDPEHPVKYYASTADLEKELTRQLRSPQYQRFFSGFVAHDQRGHFFSELNRRLSQVKWHAPEPGNPQPTWRDTPIEHPKLQLAISAIAGDLSEHLYQRKLNKILNDAATLAVPTAAVDRNARWARWDSFVSVATSILQIAAFVVLPFVPFLGEMMMAYMAYQFLDEVFEGIVDWAEGSATEAGEQLFAALESLVQFGAFGIGGSIALAELPRILPAPVVAFIDRFRPVKLRNGKTQYWKPDLKPYEQQALPPDGSVPDPSGLHEYQGRKWLPAEQGHYAVSHSGQPDKLYIEHPSRPDAYRPTVFHNGEGAFHTELERPLEWDRPTVLQRLGPSVESLPPARRERLLQVSGCDEDVLRRMHMNREPMPPLLADSLQRFLIDRDLQDFIDRIGSSKAEDYLTADPLIQLQLLKDQHLWPSGRRLRLFSEQGDVVWQSSTDQQLPLTDIHENRLTDGDLLKTLLQTLDNHEINTLLEEEFGQVIALEVRTRNLRARLTQIATTERTALFETRYQALQHRDEPLARTVALHEPRLPAKISEALLNTATGSELLEIEAGNWPARQQELAQEARHELRVTRAYEGLELDSVRNPDSDTLALHSLQRLPGWSGDVRLEVRSSSPQGQLLDSTGPESAAIRRVLVLDANGRWKPYDQQGLELQGTADFYTCVLQALPDAQRQALNLHIGEGEKLRQALRDNPLPRSDLRLTIVDEPPSPPAIETLRLTGAQGYARETPRTPRTLENRIRQVYPRLLQGDLQDMVARLQAHPDGANAELSRLSLEYAQLDSDLNQWIHAAAPNNPETGLSPSLARQMATLRDRQLFAHLLRKCWRRETPEAIGFRLLFSEPLPGDLPVLSANFDHITNLELTGTDNPGGVDAFLQRFPNLQRLALNHFDLDDLPQSLQTMPSLRQLRLRQCGVVLTPQNQLLLSSLNELTALDLQGNPLGITMDVNGLSALTYLNLMDTGISALPAGLLDHPRIRSAWLAGNQITSLPDVLFELSPSTGAIFDFAGNPLSNATREQVKVYFNRTGNYMGVRPEQPEIDRTKMLFTDLNDRQASELIYRLPGSLAQGRLQLDQWEAEITRLTADLTSWARDIPDRNPLSGETLTFNERLEEHFARETFAGRLERLWRHRSTTQPLVRAETLTGQATFMGDMPVLSADFSHIRTLSLSGNKSITSTSSFLASFPRLTTLVLRDFTLDRIAQTLARLPALEALVLNNCGVTFSAEAQAALAAMPVLDSLELPGNPLGDSPDVGALSQLNYLDLSSTGINEAPVGMTRHPNLRTAIVSDNRISEFPEDFFQLPATVSEGFDFSGNPLSAETRERIKTYSREIGPDFGVPADAADIAATKALFPALDTEEASDVFYGLPGDLEQGRSLLRHWKAEIEQLVADLEQWKTAIPASHPVSGQLLSPAEMFVEHTRRTAFADQLERLWHMRSSDNPRQRHDTLITTLTFIGELPRLSADFSHIAELSVHGSTTLSATDAFLGSFTGLRHLELHDFNLAEIPRACARMPSLQRLILENCGLSLTSPGQTILSPLNALQYLNLSRNPLGAPPPLESLPALTHLRLVDTQLTSVPDGLLTRPRLTVAILDRNRISELPEDLFDIPVNTPRQFTFADNPLTAATRDRIKVCFQQHRQNFGVSMPNEDLDRLIELFPSLDREDAERVLYLLPGTIEQGRAQIARWESERRQLVDELDRWVNDIPERFPATDEVLSQIERDTERAEREAFRLELEAFWRERLEENPETRAVTLSLNLAFIGDMPSLSTDFSHVTALSLHGNSQLRINDSFLHCFPGLETLELRELALGRIPQSITRMPALEELALSDCDVVLDSEGHTALGMLTRLKSLDLYRNPLGMVPDLRNLRALEYLDLSATAITELPAGLLNHPALETVVLNNNRITELPEDVFALPAAVGNGYDFGDNPLNAATRDRIKIYYRRNGEDLGVMAEMTDLIRVQTLHPALDDEQASAFIYRLDGSLADGRSELTRLETELATLLGDLAAWEADLPVNDISGQPLDAAERLKEEQNRARFKEELLTCWRKTPLEGADIDDHRFASSLPLRGELPTLTAQFGHVSDLYLLSVSDHSPRIGRFLEAFPSLDSLDIRGYDLRTVPEAIFRMGRLTSLSLPECNITLTPNDVHGLAGLHTLELLHLQDNPLGLAPDLSNLQALTDLDLSTTGIREIPRGALGNFNWMEIDLSGNEISEMPDELMEVPAYVGDRYDLRGNPFSIRAMNRIRAYFQETGNTLNVDGILDHPPQVIRPGVNVED